MRKAPLLSLPALLALALPAAADCAAGDELFMSCTIAGVGKRLEVCFNTDSATYRYGPEGAPEITLRAPIATLGYRPWPGVGSSIWEEVEFPNDVYRYTVSAGFDRTVLEGDAAERMWGGVEVFREDMSLAALTCAPESVRFDWNEGLFAAKQAAGLDWDYAAHVWRPAGGG